MNPPQKTLKEINERIAEGNAVVVTADEMTALVAELGVNEAAKEVDVVTTGTFGAMCSSGVWLNFGHSEPPIKMTKVWINDVEAYAGVAAVDAYLGATQPSITYGLRYGGGNVIEDLLKGKKVHIRAESYGTDCYPRTALETELSLQDLNQAIMSNPRNCYERYTVAVNASTKTLYTYMGKLLPNLGNATFSGAGALAPINNDPTFQTIGIGTKIFLGGGEGFIVGAGTQHHPEKGFSTLMVQGNLKHMSARFVRGANFERYGCSLYIGVGVPIPILNPAIAKFTAISDEQITTPIMDYGVPSRSRPVIGITNYADLKSGSIEVNGTEIKTAPLSSFKLAKEVAEELRTWILKRTFFLTKAIQPLPLSGTAEAMKQQPISKKPFSQPRDAQKPKGNVPITLDERRCIHCGLCLAYCPNEVFQHDTYWRITVTPENCSLCYTCEDICPQKAIYLRRRSDEKIHSAD
ncbi:MAG: homocysteine biosynthesis protein [Candidatus Heimdallarchaeota archaeon]